MTTTPTFQYIAGFFDGEGCISLVKSSGMFNISIGQAKRADRVMPKIAAFLRSKGIRATVGDRPRQKPSHKDQNYLIISDWKSQRLFLNRILPWLIVKREKSDIALARFKSDPPRVGSLPEERLAAARAAYWSGLSFRQVEIRHKVGPRSLRDYMLTFGERGRPRSEAVKAWHSDRSNASKTRWLRGIRRGAKARWSRYYE